ncbi:hypothetical protein IE53DRAFT_384894 [Violaceomyces palustris]|uniref:Uncharacterized protein n=1 Tax=Violaceomyces palustris TaxID=1673888 RepID=A0ACD0P3K5_9BASI|nr:hypothetical protein IE53DRAFT_384894 [Violaceomyces palustris]
MTAELQIHAALCPRVAVLSSEDVDQLVQENGVNDLSSLLRPFESTVERLSVRTSQLENKTCERFPLRFDPLSVFQAGPSLSGIGEVLDNVSSHISANAKRWDTAIVCPRVQSLEDLASSGISTEPLEKVTPWFADFRDMLLRHRSVSRHETFGHPVAVLLAVSSRSPDPMNDFARLYEASQSASVFENHPYVDPHILRYYVVIHDVNKSGPDLTQSLELLSTIKRTYGLHCCLLPLNSATSSSQKSRGFSEIWARALQSDPRAAMLSPNISTPQKEDGGDDLKDRGRWSTPGAPENEDAETSEARKLWRKSLGEESGHTEADGEYGRLLDDEDVKRLKGFVRELTAQSVVPFMERCVQQWNEQLAASRRGLTGRLFGASRKLFGSSKNTSQGSQVPGYNVQYDYYPHSALEAQTRRLADFAFTIRDYKLAAAMYDLGRKDFASDKAWRYSAGATEMFGLSHLMIMLTTRSSPIDVDSYLAQACQDHATHGDAELSGLKATLLYYEVYRALNHYRTAPSALIRAAGFAEEVYSPLLLEQAAISDLRLTRPALRKYAVHLVMAGHRYQACGQKQLSLRCYAQAAAFYEGKDWTLIENHVEHELGIQASNEGNSREAVAHLMKLIRSSPGEAEQHAGYLSEVLNAFKYIDGVDGVVDKEGLPMTLIKPIFESQKACIRVDREANQAPAIQLVDEGRWDRLEAQFLERGFRSEGDQGKKRKKPDSLSVDRTRKAASVDETFWIELIATNPLNTRIKITNVRPHIKEETSGDKELQMDEQPDGIVAESLAILELEARESRVIAIPVKSSKPGKFRGVAVSFLLEDLLPLKEVLEKKGKRLTATKAQRMEPAYAQDQSLVITIHEPKPVLSVDIKDRFTFLGLGEEKTVALILENEGTVPLTDLRVLVDSPASIHFPNPFGTKASPLRLESKNDLDEQAPFDVPLEGDELVAGRKAELPLVLRGSSASTSELCYLFVFRDSEGQYHSHRFAHQVQVEPILEVVAHCQPSMEEEVSYNVTIEATNVSSSGNEVKVKAISFISPHWVCSSEIGKEGTRTLLPCQTSRHFGLLKRDESQLDQGNQVEKAWPISDLSFTIKRLSQMLQSREVDEKIKPPPTSLWHMQLFKGDKGDEDGKKLSPLFTETRQRYRSQLLSNHFPTMTHRDRRLAFTLFEPLDVDVVVDWEMRPSSAGEAQGKDRGMVEEDVARTGQTYLFGLKLGSMKNEIQELLESGGGQGIRSMYEETAKEKESLLNNLLKSYLAKDDFPLQVDLLMDLEEAGKLGDGEREGGEGGKMKGASAFKHDFKRKGPLTLGVWFHVRNMAISGPASSFLGEVDPNQYTYEIRLFNLPKTKGKGRATHTFPPEAGWNHSSPRGLPENQIHHGEDASLRSRIGIKGEVAFDGQDRSEELPVGLKGASDEGLDQARWIGKMVLKGELGCDRDKNHHKIKAHVKIPGPGLKRIGGFQVVCHVKSNKGISLENGAGGGDVGEGRSADRGIVIKTMEKTFEVAHQGEGTRSILLHQS